MKVIVKYGLVVLLIAGIVSPLVMSHKVLAQQCQSSVDPNCNPSDPDSIPNNPGTAACTSSFLTLPAWYNGLLDSDCEIKSPTEVGGFTQFVTKIGLNVVEMILRLSGYASAAFIIYGGYKYIYSAGSPDGMVSARKTIMNAVIGLVISIAAVAIVNTIANGI